MDISWIIELYARAHPIATAPSPFQQPNIPEEVYKIREKYRRKKPQAGADEGDD